MTTSARRFRRVLCRSVYRTMLILMSSRFALRSSIAIMIFFSKSVKNGVV